MANTIVGIMGPAAATAQEQRHAFELGALTVREGWTVLTGGRRHGVMHAALEGAHSAGGLTIGVLPSDDPGDISPAVDFAIVTGIGEARNLVNVLTSRVVFVCGMSAGTASEVALALKADRPVILIQPTAETWEFCLSLDRRLVHRAATPVEAVAIARPFVAGRDRDRS
jgi:uncharacterized protein (TIGR00725 family)